MKRPWQIWLLFLLGLAAVVPAFAWLTVKALELDRAESLARRQAALEKDISVALWRMDVLLTPLLAEEAARPDFVYRAVYPTDDAPEPAKGKPAEPALSLSPLLANPPSFVLLHFEVHPDGSVSSPQNPTGRENTWAVDNGISPQFIGQAANRLQELEPVLAPAVLLAQLPDEPQTLAEPPGTTFAASVPPPAGQNTVISNTYEDLNQQLAQSEGPPPQPNPPPQSDSGQQAVRPVAPPNDGEQAPNQASDFSAQPQGGNQLAYSQNTEPSRQQQRLQSQIANNDLANRGAALQAYALRSAAEQRGNYKAPPKTVRVVEGVSRRFWLGERLIQARRVQIGDETIIQGCWLDWNALQTRLKAEVADLLPAVELRPVSIDDPEALEGHLLATLPVQLAVTSPLLLDAGWTPIRISLVVAWACLLVTVLAAAMMLHSVITLSERRGAFVSAVTHELRTPLTTFRMYAEMLAGGMVPEADQRQRYLETLRVEADRLAHLVENVLQYARLERGRPGKRREEVSIASLLDRCESRLAERAAQAEMRLEVEAAEADREVTLATDSAAVEQIVFNLVDNACKYAGQANDKRIHLEIAADARRVRIAVRDHGPGISRAGRKKLFRPFSKSVHEAASTAPGVGLGLALCRRLAADLGGRLDLESPAESGAAFVLTLPLS
ncbi:MAG TPA: HAMP domain-containing sensor histidine kinase [Pirellulaceae bacterium]|nr:HAMP domain-containing sensor histidine kinase [Pirellulaceae bacterium]